MNTVIFKSFLSSDEEDEDESKLAVALYDYIPGVVVSVFGSQFPIAHCFRLGTYKRFKLRKGRCDLYILVEFYFGRELEPSFECFQLPGKKSQAGG